MEIRKGEAAGASAHVIACFDDTGLDAARQVAKAPVIGIGEAAYHAATLIAPRFTVVTTLSRSIPALEHNLLKYGFERRSSVRAAEVPVLALEDETSDARARIDVEIARALAEDHAEAIVLGCAAVKLAEALVSLGLKTSKLGGYSLGSPKPLTGPIADLT